MRAVVAACLIDRNHLPIGEQRQRRGVEVAQVTAHDQRRTGDRPERHQRALLVRREAGIALAQRQPAERQHVGVGPTPRPTPGRPVFQARKLRLQHRPFIPEVVRDAPHLRIFSNVIAADYRRFAGRETEDDGAAGRLNRLVRRLDLRRMGVVGTAHIVHLDEIDAPVGIEAEDAVIIGLRAGPGHVHAIHVRVPGADAGPVGDVGGTIAGAKDRQICLHRRTRDAAHDMDAEFEAQRMHRLRQRREALAPYAGGEAIGRGDHPAMRVHRGPGLCIIGVARRVGLIPLDVDGEDIIAERQQLVGHDLRGFARLCFSNGGGEAVPAVPAHGRTRGEHGCAIAGLALGRLRDRRSRQSHHAARQHRTAACFQMHPLHL